MMLRSILLVVLFMTPRLNAAQSVETSHDAALDYSTLVLTTSLEMENPVSELATFFVQQGYTLNFMTLNATQFSTQERELVVAEDLEYKVKVAFFVKKIKQDPLPIFHIGIVWRYGEENGPGVLDATPPEIMAYKEKYKPIYTKRIWSYIDKRITTLYQHALFTHPLVDESAED